jgi:PAS domain S-box-containing protein
MIVLSPDLRVLHMNRSAEEILGYRNQEVRGQPIEYILIGSENVTQALANAKRGIPTYDQADSRLFRRSGQGFLVQLNTLPVLLDDEVQGVVVLIQDLSEKEQIQVHAQQLEQRALLGEVTAVFAHEVRNPINNISTGLQLMALNLPDTDPNQEIIARLQQDCDRLAELMKSVLSYSHPSDYEMEPVDLGALITRMIERMRTKLSRSKIKNHIQIEPDIPLILGNPRALEQVFTNLISNAMQAMGDQEGTLAVKIQAVKTPGRRAAGSHLPAVLYHEAKRHRAGSGDHPSHHYRSQGQLAGEQLPRRHGFLRSNPRDRSS